MFLANILSFSHFKRITYHMQKPSLQQKNLHIS